MSKQWANKTLDGITGNNVRNIRNSDNYGMRLLQAEILFKLVWTVGIWYPDGKYAGTLVNTDDRSLDLVEVEQ
jgi:hypothetical protein